MGNVTIFDDEAVQGPTEIKDKTSNYIKFQEQDINSHFDDKGLRVLSLPSTRGMQDLDGHFFRYRDRLLKFSEFSKLTSFSRTSGFPESVGISENIWNSRKIRGPVSRFALMNTIVVSNFLFFRCFRKSHYEIYLFSYFYLFNLLI